MTDTPEPLSDAELEALAAEIHVVYCEEYERRFGEPYWTGGDYSKLDEPTKNYDRNLVRWHLDKTVAAREELEQAKAAHPVERLNNKLVETADEIANERRMKKLMEDYEHTIASLRQRAETAEAQVRQALGTIEFVSRKRLEAEAGCAALREALAAEIRIDGNMCGNGPYGPICVRLTGERCAHCRAVALLAKPNPGAGVLERLRQYEGKALAYDDTGRRGGEAQAYCQRYLMPDAWGNNIWHAILDDALRMRAALAQAGGQEQAT